jgi:enoyl-CoA hydratase/carnithine racemase
MNHLLIEKKRNVTTITLNRPEKANAITIDMMLGLKQAFLDIQNDHDTTIVVLQSTGEKHFSAGVDTQEILALPPQKKKDVYLLMVEVSRLALTMDKLLIVALNGLMLGMGCALCLGGDLRVAVDRPEVIMQMLEVDVGMFPFFVMALSYYHFPPSIATKLVFGAEKFTLAEMQQHRFIYATFAPEEFEKGLKKIIRFYAGKSPDMIRQAKACYCQEREVLLKQLELEHQYSEKFYDSLA